MPASDLYQEAARQMTVCNACRYCEGYCAVFPAMELRQSFTNGDLTQLANLCHDCRACYYACMYAPPHEFGINVPQVLAAVRQDSYRRYAWPTAFSRLFTDVPLAGVLAAAAAAGVLLLAWILAGPGRLLSGHAGPGAFYQVVAYWAMVVPGVLVGGYWAAVWVVGGARFWHDTGTAARGRVGVRAVLGAARDALVLRWQRGGGPGCPYPGPHASFGRSILHILVVAGFLAAVASTTLAAIYQDLLDRLPPYPLTSAPVVLGALGGAAMIVGTVGMLVQKGVSDRAPGSEGQRPLDAAFVITLGVASLTGILTLVLRATQVMGVMLTVHLGVVAALFLTAPYGKFIHAVYRFLALVRHRLEQDHAA
ncbi:MAG TPA: tricarballylate utilization 4Fe-4S protein TcuB [bacterium]|nr:tricarballylate utilization 4Fe-4S protein TcuB [bacterium]